MKENQKIIGENRFAKYACLHTAVCPVFILDYYFFALHRSMNSGTSDDVTGWAALFLLSIGIFVIPFVLLDTIPFFITLKAAKKQGKIKKVATVSMVISDIILALVFMVVARLSLAKPMICTMLIIAEILYIFSSIYISKKLSQTENSEL